MHLFKRLILVGGVTIWACAVLLESRARHGGPASGAVSVIVRIAVGCIVVSAVAALLDRRFPGRVPDPLVASAWSIGRGTILALLFLLVAALFTGGVATTLPGVVVGVLLAGVVGGGAHALWSRRRLDVMPGAGAIQGQSTDSPGQGRRRTADSVWQFLWFLFGCSAALLLLVPVAAIANQFRGPTDGITELGTWAYVQDQRPVNAAAGVAVAGLGWMTGLLFRARKSPPAFVGGVIITATLLGIAFAMLPR